MLQTCTFAFMNRFTDGLQLPSEDEAIRVYQETYGATWTPSTRTQESAGGWTVAANQPRSRRSGVVEGRDAITIVDSHSAAVVERRGRRSGRRRCRR